MRFEHRFTVSAPQEAVAAFHASARALKAITPPPIIMQVHHAPEPLGEGDHVVFTMWLGPIPVRWDSLISDVSVEGFTDTQVQGAFGSWVHRHNFIRVDDATTEVYDVVEAAPGRGLFFGLLSRLMWAGNGILFAYRARRTRRLLERGKAERSEAQG